MGGVVKAIFGGGGSSSTPQTVSTPTPPSVVNTSNQADIEAQQVAANLNRGRTATMVTGGAGLSNMGTTSKTLLGN